MLKLFDHKLRGATMVVKMPDVFGIPIEIGHDRLIVPAKVGEKGRLRFVDEARANQHDASAPRPFPSPERNRAHLDVDRLMGGQSPPKNAVVQLVIQPWTQAQLERVLHLVGLKPGEELLGSEPAIGTHKTDGSVTVKSLLGLLVKGDFGIGIGRMSVA